MFRTLTELPLKEFELSASASLELRSPRVKTIRTMALLLHRDAAFCGRLEVVSGWGCDSISSH